MRLCENVILAEEVASVGLPVSASDTLEIPAKTPEELARVTVENGFSAGVAANVSRLARLPSVD